MLSLCDLASVHASEPPPAEPIANPRWRAWEVVFLCLLGGSILLTSYLVSTRRYLTHDEFITAVLASEPSLIKMLRAIAHGVEVNPPLLFILEWVVVRIFGNGELALRAISGLSIAAAVPVLYVTIRKAVPPSAAALAVGLVIGLSRDVYEFVGWARYYGWMILLAAVAGYLFMRFATETGVRKRDYVWVFLVHCAMVYTHLFGFFFSGMLLLAHVLLDYLNRGMRWRLYATIASAWATFLLWAPVLPQQLSVTKDGTYTPRVDVGTFFEALEMQIPFPVVLLAAVSLAVLRWLSARDSDATIDQSPTPNPYLTVLLVLSLAWIFVAVATWAGSHVIRPFFMRRYVAPCVNAWIFVVAGFVAALYQAPFRQRLTRISLPRWCHSIALTGVLAFCIVWQPLRAWTDPPKGLPFVDSDYGHDSLPIVFEDGMDFLPRLFYGSGREYVLVLDREASAADPGYFTKLAENCFVRWRPFFPHARILYYDELPAWPNGYLVVDDELAKTFDWLFQNKAEIKAEMLGPWETGNKVYRVQPPPAR